MIKNDQTFPAHEMRIKTYILALLHSNGTDIESIGLTVLVAEVKDIDTATAAGNEDVAGLRDLVLDGLLFNDLNQGWAGRSLIPGMDASPPQFVPTCGWHAILVFFSLVK